MLKKFGDLKPGGTFKDPYSSERLMKLDMKDDGRYQHLGEPDRGFYVCISPYSRDGVIYSIPLDLEVKPLD